MVKKEPEAEKWCSWSNTGTGIGRDSEEYHATFDAHHEKTDLKVFVVVMSCTPGS